MIFHCINMWVFFVNSYRPSLPVAFIAKELGYNDEADCLAWLVEKNITLLPDKTKVDCKTSTSAISSIQ